MLYNILMVVHVVIAVAMISLILLQHGKGADAGAAFGSGASGTVFGSRGSGSFLSHTTAWLAVVFFLTSLSLAYLASSNAKATSVMEKVKTEQTAPKKAPPAGSANETKPATKPAAEKQAAPAKADNKATPAQTESGKQKPKTNLPVGE